jgi:spore maturation protein CgeB
VYEEGYADAVGNARITLGLLREVCPDQHTTRTFEIPAMGGFMLADRTEEHMQFFREGEEAEFFSSDEEYLEKLSFYLSNHGLRRRIAEAGRARCLSSGYSYDERIAAVLRSIGLRKGTTVTQASR